MQMREWTRLCLMDTHTQRKWDFTSRNFDWLALGDERRLGPDKRRLFAKIRGSTLMVGAGTGNDFKYFPPGHRILAIDISPKMLERAAAKLANCDAGIELRHMDVCELGFPDASFDTVVTVCTFCSVAKPVLGLREIYRVLKPDGQLLMFEHVRSRIGPVGIFLDLMTPLARRFGPELNRDTVGNVQKAGFRIRREENVYLDIVKIIEADKERA
jgi:ubiquinone/menaquinone biosynthesis C-methylase UbiE